MRITGKALNAKWRVGAKHALYLEHGNWYHPLRRFPGALFDANGYVIFQTEQDFKDSPYLKIRKRVHVRHGISSLPGYVRVVVDGKEAVPQAATHSEGAPYDVTQTRYERDPVARAKCIEHWGTSCRVCSFNFADVYGKAGENVIHVHHLNPMAGVGEEHQVDPVEDLRPVCPNCHAIIHKRNPPYRLEEVREMIGRQAAASRSSQSAPPQNLPGLSLRRLHYRERRGRTK